MIIFIEKEKKMLSGTKSIFIYFEYNIDIINIIKSSGTYYYIKNDHSWEVPLTSLSYLLDNLTYMDDIKLIFDTTLTTIYNNKPILKYKTKPFNYQLEGITYGLNHDKWLLLDAPGLGKTLQLIYLAEELKEQRGIEHCLVICGIATLRTNWKKEIQKHSKLDCMILGEKINSKGNTTWMTIKERVNQLKNNIKEFFIIVNIETLRDNSIIQALNKGPNKIDCMFFDECHKAKGWSSKQGQNLIELDAKYKVAATGTLIMNNPLDAYVPLVWIGKEKKKSVTRFKNTYCVFDYTTRGRILGYKNLDILKDEIDNCSLRRTKDLLDLPPKNIINEFIEMNPEQYNFYEEIKKSVKQEYKQEAIKDCDKIKLQTSNLLSLITRLWQATSCPSVLTSKLILSSKLERAKDLVDEITSNNDKVVIFSNFKEPIYKLQEILSEYNPLIGTGDMKDEEVSNNIDKFQTSNKFKVFLGTISKMGTGVTLTKASYMIFIDQPWTEALYTQACDRIYRIGSEKPVFIYNLICTDTIDETVSNIIERKKAISGFIVDDNSDNETMKILQDYIKDL